MAAIVIKHFILVNGLKESTIWSSGQAFLQDISTGAAQRPEVVVPFIALKITVVYLNKH